MEAFAAALVFASLVAWDAFRRWLVSRAADRVGVAGLQKLTEQFDMHIAAAVADSASKDMAISTHRAELDHVLKLLAIDFKKAIDGLSADVARAREHVDTRLTGSLAQQTQTGRGLLR